MCALVPLGCEPKRQYGSAVNWATIILLGLFGAPVAAGAAWVARNAGIAWTARERVFNSAAIAPVMIASGAACFAIVILTLGGTQKFAGAEAFLLEAITTLLAMFVIGMIAAYLVERLKG
jgi:hypothetical protein